MNFKSFEHYENILGELKKYSKTDKSKLTYMLDEINSIGRPDAHAKAISEDEFAQVRLYFKKIEAILEKLA